VAEPSSADLATTAHHRFQEAYAKRIREHGERRFRWPDGSLRAERPPANPLAAANRTKWAALVAHCRTHGGDREHELTGKSWRYGIGISREEHARFLRGADLEPEFDEDGRCRGCDAEITDALGDPLHALNSYYKAGAEEVFREARGRVL
jgi:hypothetical protein